MKLQSATILSSLSLIAAQAPAGGLAGIGKVPIPNGPAPTGCSDYEVLFGRGTSEPGPFGLIVGDPLLKDIQQKMPSVRGYAIQYPASAANESVRIGAEDIIARLDKQTTDCPKQRFALVGYSQGALIYHLATASEKWNADKFNSKIVALAMYGDPGSRDTQTKERPIKPFPEDLQKKTVNNCAMGDPVCDSMGDFQNFRPHLTYNDANTTYHEKSTMAIVDGFNKKETTSAGIALSPSASASFLVVALFGLLY